MLLNHHDLLASPEIKQLARGHFLIYQTDDVKKNELQRTANRQIYIAFYLDQFFAIPMSEVSEVIDYPKQLIQSPGVPQFVLGQYDLRGSLITIVDTRSVYHLPSHQKAEAKVLIFLHQGERFGLVVDSVESILTVRDDQILKLPHLLYRETEHTFQGAVKEALQIALDHGEKQVVIVLNPLLIAEKIKSAS